MKTTAVFFFLILGFSSLSFGAETFGVKEAKIVIANPIHQEFSLLVGTNVSDNYESFHKYRGEIVIEGENEIRRYPVAIVFSPLSFGATAGFSAAYDSEISLSQIQNKSVNQLLGQYTGARTGVAATLVGTSYFIGKNESGALVRSWDYRSGLKVDFLTGDAIIILRDYQNTTKTDADWSTVFKML